MLSMYKRTFFGELVKKENKDMKDIHGREIVALGSLVFLIITLGVYPKVILEPLDLSVQKVIKIMDVKSVEERTKERLRSLNTIGEVK
jgi:NADH-quinone oxidoreductase subunit M